MTEFIGFVSKKGERTAYYEDQIQMFSDWEYEKMLLTEDEVNMKCQLLK